MSTHLTECPQRLDGFRERCICPEPRACEQRVRDTIRRDSWYEDGYAAGIQAAIDAVAALDRIDYDDGMAVHGPFLLEEEVVAAIDALREVSE